jgi:hypothetical protein
MEDGRLSMGGFVVDIVLAFGVVWETPLAFVTRGVRGVRGDFGMAL